MTDSPGLRKRVRTITLLKHIDYIPACGIKINILNIHLSIAKIKNDHSF